MISKRYLRMAAVALLGAVAGCTDFLTEDGVFTDPNNPTVATRDQFFVAVQALQFGQQEANIPLLSCLYMQQCSGASNFVETWDAYGATADETRADFSNIYTGGGLIDIRRVQDFARASGDSVFLGVAKVWEALMMSYGADIWGDIPYSDAVGTTLYPAFDGQMAIYASLQTLLDQAIAELAGPGPGPVALDLVYGDGSDSTNKTKWRQAAYTLKARLHMHTAEVLGAPAYTAAIAAANLGIATPANNFTAFHGGSGQERNLWNQLSGTAFGQYVVAGKRLVDLMVARNDPRLPEYFGEWSDTAVVVGPHYGGKDVNGSVPANRISPLLGTRNAADFRQPILTFDENQLILAEAKFQTTGAVSAAGNLNAVRAQYAQLPIVTPTLAQIMTEKYITMFQNIEVWNDYKRTCLPAITPVTGSDPFEVPGRVFYGTFESAGNPNTPSTASELANGGVAGGRPGVGGFRNPNDPNPCP